MNIMIIGSQVPDARAFISKLNTICSGKDSSHPRLRIDEIFECDIDSAPEDLERYCDEADFVFDLAGIERTDDASVNTAHYDFTKSLLDCLKKNLNYCPVMLASSVRAALDPPFGTPGYCGSRAEMEELLFEHSIETGARILIYRLEESGLLSEEDLADELLLALEGREHRCEFEGTVPVPDELGRYCWVQM